MKNKDISLAGISEPQTFKASHLSDATWVWDPGVETRPTALQSRPPGGLGFFRARNLSYSIVHLDPSFIWARVQLSEDLPIFVCECHFPHSSDTKGHRLIWSRLSTLTNDYKKLGYVIILGDFNAHTDSSHMDTAGRILVSESEKLDLDILNHSDICKGSSTWSCISKDGTIKTTAIDYVLASKQITPYITSMEICEDNMGSDHNPILITIQGLDIKQAPASPLKEVWRLDKIPVENSQPYQSFLRAYQGAFDEWIDATRGQIEALRAIETDNTRIAELVEWSFQKCLDEVSLSQIGKKTVGPPSAPNLTKALRILNEQRLLCEYALKKTISCPKSSEEDRSKAVSLYRKAKSNFMKAMATRRQIAELKTFTQIEENQSNSKKFWAAVKKISGGLRNNSCPIPMVQMPTDSSCETDPVTVLKIWRQFGKDSANPGKSDEGRFDEDFKRNTEKKLDTYRALRIFQSHLDAPITRKEIFRAIRKMKVGKAPGIDGILTSILKPAAAAVGSSKLKDYNPVIDALELMFNFIFEKEVWPQRWAEGIIFPLYKNTGSRLDPGNYRPITLLSTVGKVFGSIIENRLSCWSEENRTIADEQGGFRRNRGTIDLIFLLREIITNRRENGRPTLVTFIDARKAYDTVWREGNYVRLHDLGVRGKLWRQLQEMNSNPKSKFRLPFGETEWFHVSRGVAQGAVESPWLYSCFINGLAEDLKTSNMGLRIAGIHTPLLMYADDIVLLASSVQELREMNTIVSNYAHRNRYTLNGDKSAVMVFNASDSLLAEVNAEQWTLSGEPVKVKQSYKYLGTETLTNLNWDHHLKQVIAKASSTSEELSWLCRREKGLRPRSAAALWKAIVRPTLEYAAELWAGDISTSRASQAESVQINFARSILGISNCQSTSHDILRAELGMEKLTCRWEKLRLGYWRRLQVTDPNRTLFTVSTMRRWQHEHGMSNDDSAWMKTTKNLLKAHNLGHFWTNPKLCWQEDTSKADWKKITYEAAERHEDSSRHSRLARLNSVTSNRYLRIKYWGQTESSFACFVGEIGRRGNLVFEHYLDDRTEKIGSLLKLTCRLGCLPILKRVAREQGLPPYSAICKLCDDGNIEDLTHFILFCKGYHKHRTSLFSALGQFLRIESLDYVSTMDLLLGASTGSAFADDRIDFLFKRFLKKSWRTRKWLTIATNSLFNRSDTAWALKSHGDDQQITL